ncbi:MAG: hypothetical protein ABR499_17035 [Gemmatimonadaceae bacterium]
MPFATEYPPRHVVSDSIIKAPASGDMVLGAGGVVGVSLAQPAAITSAAPRMRREGRIMGISWLREPHF